MKMVVHSKKNELGLYALKTMFSSWLVFTRETIQAKTVICSIESHLEKSKILSNPIPQEKSILSC